MIINRTSPGINKPYEPLIWNDTGIYSYFYIDFQKALGPLTAGMWQESIVVYGSGSITVTAVEKINASTYKVYANITNLPHGYTVMHKKTTRLTLADGATLPAFSIWALVTGQTSYLDGGYLYDGADFSIPALDIATTESIITWVPINGGSTSDSINYTLEVLSSCTDTPNIVLT